MHDDKTLRGYPLPHKENLLADDVERLRKAFIAIDADFSKIENNISSEVNTKISELETKIQDKLNEENILEKLGLYIDDDGDLCQD